MLYTAAMPPARASKQQAGRAGPPGWAGGAAPEVAAEGGREALGGLLLLESPFRSRSQHPPAQGHRVRGRAFGGQATL